MTDSKKGIDPAAADLITLHLSREDTELVGETLEFFGHRLRFTHPEFHPEFCAAARHLQSNVRFLLQQQQKPLAAPAEPAAIAKRGRDNRLGAGDV